MLVVANYHYVRPEYDFPFPGIRGVTPEGFEAQLRLLGSVGEYVSGADVLAAVCHGKALPERSLLVTFDDGLEEQYEHALPVLKKLGIPALFFVNTEPVADSRVSTVHKIHLLRATVDRRVLLETLDNAAREIGVDVNPSAINVSQAQARHPYDTPEDARLKYLLNFVLDAEALDRIASACFSKLMPSSEIAISRSLYMSMQQLISLAELGCLGSHGHSHVSFEHLSMSDIRSNIRRASELLRSWTGKPATEFSYPYGTRPACVPEAAAALRAQGLRISFTMERAGNADLSQPMFLARFACNDLPGGHAARWDAEALFENVPPASWFRDECRA